MEDDEIRQNLVNNIIRLISVLASSEIEQKAYSNSLGFPIDIKDDFAEDLHMYLNEQIGGGIDVSAYFNAKQMEILRQIDSVFDEKSDGSASTFWVFFDKAYEYEWEWIRLLAKEFLAMPTM
ncbi:MAG: hypothetical protein ABJN65_09445 [Parasphingorhabdus sp.]